MPEYGNTSSSNITLSELNARLDSWNNNKSSSLDDTTDIDGWLLDSNSNWTTAEIDANGYLHLKPVNGAERYVYKDVTLPVPIAMLTRLSFSFIVDPAAASGTLNPICKVSVEEGTGGSNYVRFGYDSSNYKYSIKGMSGGDRTASTAVGIDWLTVTSTISCFFGKGYANQFWGSANGGMQRRMLDTQPRFFPSAAETTLRVKILMNNSAGSLDVNIRDLRVEY